MYAVRWLLPFQTTQTMKVSKLSSSKYPNVLKVGDLLIDNISLCLDLKIIMKSSRRLVVVNILKSTKASTLKTIKESSSKFSNQVSQSLFSKILNQKALYLLPGKAWTI